MNRRTVGILIAAGLLFFAGAYAVARSMKKTVEPSRSATPEAVVIESDSIGTPGPRVEFPELATPEPTTTPSPTPGTGDTATTGPLTTTGSPTTTGTETTGTATTGTATTGPPPTTGTDTTGPPPTTGTSGETDFGTTTDG